MTFPHLTSHAGATVLPVRGAPGGGFTCGVFDAEGAAILASVHRFSDQPPRAQPERLPDGPAPAALPEAIFGGVLHNHFGHFLMESLGRLWMANDPAFRHLPILVQTPWGRPQFSKPDDFSAIILDLLEIDPARLQVVTAPLQVGLLHLPEQLYGFHNFHAPAPEFVAFLRVAQANILRLAAPVAQPAAKVFMSRSDWQDQAPTRGIAAGLRRFEDYLRGEGWHIVQPETLSLRDQLVIYATARTVMICEGSAQHSCILLPDMAGEVFVLLRRPHPWDVARVTRQFGGLGTRATALQEVEKSYAFGQPAWSGMTVLDYTRISAVLQAAGTVAAPFAAWADLKEAEVRQSLQTYIEAIRAEPAFLDFMRKL